MLSDDLTGCYISTPTVSVQRQHVSFDPSRLRTSAMADVEKGSLPGEAASGKIPESKMGERQFSRSLS
jgi:hypothetical protein